MRNWRDLATTFHGQTAGAIGEALEASGVNHRHTMAWRLALLGVLCAVGWCIYTYVLWPSGALDWDEAAHALRGLLMAQDVQRGDWLGLLYDSYRQVYWPPVHAWLTGLAFVVGGASPVAARLVSLLAFMLAAAALYLAACQLTSHARHVAASIAVALFLTSPALLPYAAQAMLEIPALLCLILTVLLYFKLTKTPGPPRAYSLLGMGVTATYFVKSNYGILLMMTLGLVWLIEARFRPSRLCTRRTWYTVLPCAVVFLFWFAYPPKLTETWRMLVNQPHGVTDPFGVDGFLFYPRAFLHLAGSPWMAALLLLAPFIVLLGRPDSKRQCLLVLVLLQALIGQLHHTKVDRSLFPIMPVLFLCTGDVLAQWWRSGPPRHHGVQWWLPRLGTGLLLAHALTLFIRALHPLVITYDAAVLRHVAAAIPVQTPTLIVGSMDLVNPSPPVLDWELSATAHVLAATHSGALQNWEAVYNFVTALEERRVPPWLRAVTLPTLTRGLSQASSLRSVYLGLPPYATYSQSPQGFTALMQRLMSSAPVDCALVLTSLALGARYPVDFIDPGLRQAGLTRVSTAHFPQGKVRIDVYRRVPS